MGYPARNATPTEQRLVEYQRDNQPLYQWLFSIIGFRYYAVPYGYAQERLWQTFAKPPDDPVLTPAVLQRDFTWKSRPKESQQLCQLQCVYGRGASS